jgi:hypothetical protein
MSGLGIEDPNRQFYVFSSTDDAMSASDSDAEEDLELYERANQVQSDLDEIYVLFFLELYERANQGQRVLDE